MSALLSARDVSVRRGEREVVRGVDLEVEPGEVLVVLGPNGAGKSTLVEALAGLGPVAAGEVRRRGRAACVLQTPGLARRSALANVELALRWWGVGGADRRTRAQEALATMGVAHLADRSATALSGGERRRVHIARGIAVRADLLLLDEPFAGLDEESRSALVADSTSVLRGSAAGVVVVVHDLDDAWALADRVLVLLDGEPAALGTPEGVFRQPPSAAVARFLGYDGERVDGDEVVLTWSRDVLVAESGQLAGTVRHQQRRRDGYLLRCEVAGGEVSALSRQPVAAGERVAMDVRREVRFPSGGGPMIRP